MKTLLTICLAVGLFACSQPSSSEADSFGGYGDTTFTTTSAISAEDILDLLAESDSIETTVRGNVGAVCQAKGCWMMMDLNDYQNMRVTFKDYGFFVPKNSKDKQAVIKGKAYVETVSVAMLQEYARDAEKSEEEIAAITAPEQEYSFVAEGVIFE